MTLCLPRASRRFLAIGLLATLAGCGMLGNDSTAVAPVPISSTDVVTTLWNGGPEGYVRIESQEITANRANQHPVSVTPQQLTNLLSEIKIRQGRSSPRLLMNDAMARRLADPLSRGLAQADPSQDLTFAIAGDVEGQSNVLSTVTVTTGRMFYQDGRLNLVFGLIQEYAQDLDYSSRGPSAYPPGQRSGMISTNVQVLPATGMLLASANRSDWVVLGSNAWTGPDGGVASSAPADNVLSGAPLATPAPAAAVAPTTVASSAVAPVPVAPANTEEYYQSFDQRLATLKRLREQNLITEQEYQSKRQQILDQL